MNDRQRDQFLWLWSKRRAPGRRAIARRGALIGAIGGLVFALVMLGVIDLPTGSRRGLSSLLDVLNTMVLLFAVSVPSFALIGFLGALRVFNHQELMFEMLLAQGARVPDQAPVLTLSDRWPVIVVGVFVVLLTAAIIALFIAFW